MHCGEVADFADALGSLTSSSDVILDRFRERLGLFWPNADSAERRQRLLEIGECFLEETRIRLAGRTGAWPADEPKRLDLSVQARVADHLADSISFADAFEASRILFEVATEVLESTAFDLSADIAVGMAVVRLLHRTMMDVMREATLDWIGIFEQRLDAARQGERQRIALDLHDRAGHTLATAHRSLESHQLQTDEDPCLAQEKVSRALEAVSDSMESIRQVTSKLRMNLMNGELEQSLRDLTATDTGDIDVTITFKGDESSLSPGHKHEIFLILREALRNVFKHSCASRADVVVEISSSQLWASVCDNGTGFDKHVQRSEEFGLVVMQHRAASIGGEVSVSSTAGNGTSVALLVLFNNAFEIELIS